MKNSILIMTIILLSFLIGCTSGETVNIKEMDVIELKQAMETDTTLIILDVRNPEELVGKHGHIDGVINIPVQELDERLNELNKYKKNHIAIICRSGNRSKDATALLNSKGFNAENVIGGMKAYNKITE
ncbi:MAG: rhodanese-like domain-containing protein [Bacteroidota bacterium]